MFHMVPSRLILALLCSFLQLPLVASSNHKVGVEIGAHHLQLLGDDRLHLMRRERQSRQTVAIEDEDVQLPRAVTTTTTKRTALTSQVKPNDKLCACNGCLLPTGFCSSIWNRFTPDSNQCLSQNGTWCSDKAALLWQIPAKCYHNRHGDFDKTSLTMLHVTLTYLPWVPWSSHGNKLFQMINSLNGDSTIATFPCDFKPPRYLTDGNKSLWVQGVYEENSTKVRQFLANHGVPSEFQQNATTRFMILNVQDTAVLAADVEKKTQDEVTTESMAGALKAHWSPQMTIAVALVTCPGTSLNADHEKVKQAFFTDFATAIQNISRNQISVTGNVTNVTIDCPANASKSDVYSYFQAVNALLKSDSRWVENEYKAMVIPNGWMSTYGLAYSPGKLSWYSDLGAEDAVNIMHEMGHNFGLDHAAIIPSNNPSGYDKHGDCSSAMSKCGFLPSYTLASNWFLGFNDVQKEIRMDDITNPVLVRINSQGQLFTSGVLLVKTVKGKDLPAFTVSYIRKQDVPDHWRIDIVHMSPWMNRVFVHELPSTPYGPTKNIATLSIQGDNARSAFLFREFSVAASVISQDKDYATVAFCKATSPAEAKICGTK